MSSPPKVVVVGAGFGGLEAARRMADMDVAVTVVDQRNHHTFQPLLYQVATAGLDSDDICYATRGIFHRQANASALKARIDGVDLENQVVTTEHGDPILYDYLVLALGAVTADFNIPGVSEHAFGLKSAAEATKIRNQVLDHFEEASRKSEAADRRGLMTVVIVGGGPTGVEMAGGFAELFTRVLKRDFPELNDNKAQVVLIEAQDRLLSTFAGRLGKKAEARLRKMGVEVKLGAQVSNVTPDAVALRDGSVIQTKTVVWAAGVKAHPLAAKMGLATDRSGRVLVDGSLRLQSAKNVFVIGDLASTADAEGVLLPQVAPVAVQGGRHVAKAIQAILDGDSVPKFSYRDRGSMATIGRNAAVVELPNGIQFTGFVGWVAWLTLHLAMLVGFRNRANVLVNWAWNYLTYDRGSRLILEVE